MTRGGVTDVAEIEVLREQVRELKRALGEGMRWPPDWGLTRNETTILAALVARQVMTADGLYTVLYAGHSDPPEEKIIGVYLFRLRGKLRPRDIAIHNRQGMGWHLSAADRARLRDAALKEG